MKTGERVSFSPGEFAALFGKQQTWGYRQIYAGKVKAIAEYGRIQIPAAEVERILASASRYEGIPKRPRKSKAQYEALKPELQSAWQEFLTKKRRTSGGASQRAQPASASDREEVRRAALNRMRHER